MRLTVRRFRLNPLPYARAGVTLAELVVAMAITLMLTVALGSAMLLATRGSEQAAALAEAPQTEAVTGQIVSDLQRAVAFTERTDAAVAFSVPDRDGDGLAETIRYAWSGTVGDPLTYEYNGSAPIVLADDVQSFSLSYLLRQVAGGSSGPQEQESEEMLLIAHEYDPAGDNRSTYMDYWNRSAQYFLPTLPSNLVSWKITRVDFQIQKTSPVEGGVVVEMQTADGHQKPSGQVLESAAVAESSLPGTWNTVEVSFDSLSELGPGSGLCLVLWHNGGSSRVRYERRGSLMTPNAHYVTSNSAGANWSKPNDREDMVFYVYGTVTTLGEPQWP